MTHKILNMARKAKNCRLGFMHEAKEGPCLGGGMLIPADTRVEACEYSAKLSIVSFGGLLCYRNDLGPL